MITQAAQINGGSTRRITLKFTSLKLPISILFIVKLNLANPKTTYCVIFRIHYISTSTRFFLICDVRAGHGGVEFPFPPIRVSIQSALPSLPPRISLPFLP